MASIPRIRVLAPDMTQPITTPLPAKKASRWNSPYDEINLHPLVSVFITQQAYSRICVHSLGDIHDQMDTNYKGQKIVGWYHTHPSMGVFLSHYDTWLHRNFFPEPWQVALVVEPVSAAGGFFIRQKSGILDPTRYFGFYELDGNYGRSMVHWTNLNQFEE